ncbi:MAG: hypothetical protein ACJAUR_000880 [Ulvibacter sp.]|jgi:hypothetical protein
MGDENKKIGIRKSNFETSTIQNIPLAPFKGGSHIINPML